jgi:hypothetical protein
MPVKRDITESRELRAWFGTVPDMLALVKVVEDMYAAERKVAAAKLDELSVGDSFKELHENKYRTDWQPDAMVFEPDNVTVSGPQARS